MEDEVEEETSGSSIAINEWVYCFERSMDVCCKDDWVHVPFVLRMPCKEASHLVRHHLWVRWCDFSATDEDLDCAVFS